ncbi:bifunctional glycosyltransferase/CDP-glycerol:glycerophosphate glycerophosphotransferase [Streptomyces sp. VRA16 Mangrove soil]|uniref:bifunctional glycosyltransferase/CDP-glycerol:glycerophosphate glycerophosphotransferase n=1 Tax=Streptomyces sp. VRA16 Mangrove soil TaxID=2817434 RepID=UPI001A9D0BD8|nr:bifunctional glycosyltransferase/CDP-glycerol:glycerophosphate glycerophosphotransferase [Streptomyces sp. VRA16 Mangrove soil]MBO1337571.1 CDP-glycerol glycerophosphotransferase family protein [Streptomyces sp. VRA16 Mangrove soil]
MTPRLTVVVPIYNVEDYLGACLESLAAQTMRDLEIVMVDDGSTDGSGDIARRFAADDARFRLVEQANAGLGAARNAGVRHATGGHLAFVDSDDVIPETAYALMLDTLEESGSDFVTGNVFRLRADGTTAQSPMFRKVMATTRTGTHVTRDWDLLADRIACNKVFRRDFWEQYELAFPEGVLFEDIPVVLPAHFRARRVDVLADTVYLWRDREGSISNKRAVPRAIHDRTESCASVSRLLATRPEWREGKRRYDESVISGDLWMFMEALPDGDAAYHEAFLDHANSYADSVDPGILDELPLALRVRWRLIRERRMSELLAFMAHEKAHPGAFRARRGLRGRRADFPVLERRLPRSVTGLGKADLPLDAKVTHAAWDDDGKLRLKGYAYIRNLPAGRLAARARVAWLRAGRRRAVPLRLRTVRAREATLASKQGLHNYDRAGFETVVDPARLVTGRASTTWNLEFGAYAGGLLPRTGPVRMSGPCPVPVRDLDDFLRIVPTLSGGRLRLRTERTRARLTGHECDGELVTLKGELAPGAPTDVVSVTVENWRTKESHTLPAAVDGRTFTATVPLSLFGGSTEAADPWGVSLLRADGTPVVLPVRSDIAPGRYGLGGGRELMVLANPHGNTELRDQTVRPVVDTVRWEECGEGSACRVCADCREPGHLLLAGSYPAAGRRELVLVHGGHDEEAVLPVLLADGRFEAVVRPHAVDGPAGVLPLAEGAWRLFLREPGDSDPDRRVPVLVAPARHAELPLVRTLRGREFTVRRRDHYHLVLASGSALPEPDRGRGAQAALRERYAAQRTLPRRDAVLHASFDGRQYSDSPRAVHEELAARDTRLEHLWVVRDQQVDVPPGVTPVALWSTEWYEALARCRYIVTNTHLPDWFERAEGQYVVQTWHGTPLKRIGRDLLGSASADPKYIATLPARADQWSLLVSPNSFATPVLRGAFGYTGDVLASGYPRNDVLHAPDRDKLAASVRDRLGIPDDRRVILYAPTWRENQPRSAGRYGLDLQLDLTAAEAALGDDHVLLVRRHYLVGGTVPVSDFVRDVSRHPDAAELLLIADVLVTDYSSMMFDFAQTGRPMLFHTYDLDHYRDSLRGFYFDFAAQSPGPLLRTSDEVIAALLDADAAVAGHREAYQRFREAFCDLDDGTAAAQVADAMLAHEANGAGR